MPIGKVAPIQPPVVEYGDKFVKIIVGAEEKQFTIHKNLICAASDFFSTALKSNFIEAAEQKVTLPEEKPEVFKLVFDWLYSARVADGVTTYMKKEDVSSGDVFWWEVYKMGDRLMMDRLRILAVSKILKIFNTKIPLIPSQEFIRSLFDTEQLPGLEAYMIEHVLYWLEQSSNYSEWGALPDAHMRFGQALAKATMQGVQWNLGGSYTAKWRMTDGRVSAWMIVGVAKWLSNAGGTQIRAKHLKRARQIKPDWDPSEAPRWQQENIGQAPGPSNHQVTLEDLVVQKALQDPRVQQIIQESHNQEALQNVVRQRALQELRRQQGSA